MSWTQTRGFNQTTATKIKNLCLGNVQSGFGIAGKYPTAWDAWLHTQQHTDPIPTGVDVPVFFSYSASIDGITKNWGHIGVSLANGRFWSDGIIYPSIQAYTSTHLPKYVGWGESVNDVKVIKQGGEMPIPDADNYYWRYGQKLASLTRGRTLTRDEFRKHIVGKTDLQAVEILSDDPEADRAQVAQQWALANRTAIEKQVADLKATLSKVQAKADLSDSLQKKVDGLLSEKTKDTEVGNSFLRWIGGLFRSGQ